MHTQCVTQRIAAFCILYRNNVSHIFNLFFIKFLPKSWVFGWHSLPQFPIPASDNMASPCCLNSANAMTHGLIWMIINFRTYLQKYSIWYFVIPWQAVPYRENLIQVTNRAAQICLWCLAPSWMTRVWYSSFLHMGQVFLPVNLSNACRQACNIDQLNLSNACRQASNIDLKCLQHSCFQYSCCFQSKQRPEVPCNNKSSLAFSLAIVWSFSFLNQKPFEVSKVVYADYLRIICFMRSCPFYIK